MDGYKYMDEAIKQANKLNDEQPNLLLECFIYDMFLSSQYVRSLEDRYQLYKHESQKWIRNEYIDKINNRRFIYGWFFRSSVQRGLYR